MPGAEATTKEKAVPDPDSTTNAPRSEGIGERLKRQYNDFAYLTYRPIWRNTGRVMNANRAPATIYETNLKDMTCSCEDKRYNRDDGEMCKHLAKAMLAHPDFTEVPELLVRDLTLIVDRAAKATRTLETAGNRAEAGSTAPPTHTPTATAEPETDPKASAVEKCDVWLATIDADAPMESDVRYNDEYDSLNIIVEESVDWWNDVMDEIRDWENSWWDGENRQWIIKQEDFGELDG